MKTIRYAPGLIALFVVAGCATTFRPWNLSMIREGMDRGEVVQILGEPDFTEVREGGEAMHYTYQEDYNPSSASIPFYDTNSDMAFRDLNNGRRFRQYEYVVTLNEGKVTGYREL